MDFAWLSRVVITIFKFSVLQGYPSPSIWLKRLGFCWDFFSFFGVPICASGLSVFFSSKIHEAKRKARTFSPVGPVMFSPSGLLFLPLRILRFIYNVQGF